VGVEHCQGGVFLQQMPQNGNEHSVFEDVGMVAGMKGVAITKHAQF
jgi:hypothetical protein